MQILALKAQYLRNITTLNVAPSPKFNVILGENGSGKTSFLESIYMLGMGRSFRTHLNRRIIQESQKKVTIFAEIASRQQRIPIGLEKNLTGENKVSIAGDNQQKIAELAGLLPLQLIYNDSFQLITSGSKGRRQFMDWGLFHVKQSFLSIWKQYHSALKQRNAALRMKVDKQQVKTWDNILITTAEQMEEMRRAYLADFIPVFSDVLHKMLEIDKLKIEFKSGWSEEKSLNKVLQETFAKDLLMGYTQYGAHRSDINIKIAKTPAQDALSRGQQKILVSSMRLAQGLLLKKLTEKTCIYLIDDLSAELDQRRSEAMQRVLIDLKAQVFVTGIEKRRLQHLTSQTECEVFHVKHGEVFKA